MKSEVESMLKSLIGLWVGDCVGNVGQFFFSHDMLKALDEGIEKFGTENINPLGRSFQHSDDTEEAIVLVNHLYNNGEILQDKLAMEFATRYMQRDPDGERFEYGLMTRKVLKDIYDGKPWKEANKSYRKNSTSTFSKVMGDITEGKSLKDAIESSKNVEEREIDKELVGSCGNGSVMRVPPLGAYFCNQQAEDVVKQAILQAEVTHCHPEGIAGSIAIAMLSYMVAEWGYNLTSEYPKGWGLCYVGPTTSDTLYEILLDYVPKGEVYDGIVKAKELPIDTPLMKVVDILGNGIRVTCQDTIPLCVFLTIRALIAYDIKEMYEKVLIETCKCFGDVDTNCAIVGGIIGIISKPPEKWMMYCQPMEGVMHDPLPEEKITSKFKVDFKAISEAMKMTEVKPNDDLQSLIKKGERSYYDGQHPHPDGSFDPIKKWMGF